MVRTVTQKPPVLNQADLFIMGEIDSPDHVELIMELEEEFDITIPDEEAEKIQTVGQAIQYIEDHTK